MSAALHKPSDFDHSDPAVVESPYDFYSALRTHAPVYQVPGAGYFIVSSYALVTKVVRDHATFSSDVRHTMQFPPELNGLFIPETALLLVDPPIHTRHKAIVSKAFAPSRVMKMRAKVQQIVDTLIDGFIERGEVDFYGEFAMPLPLMLIADQLGMPRSQGEKIREWSDALVVPFSVASTDDDRRALVPRLQEMNAYFEKTLAEKRVNPTEDLISDLATLEAEADPSTPEGRSGRLTLKEAVSIIQLLMTAGNESSTSGLCSLFHELALNPALADQLRANPALVGPVIEEVLRLESPAQGFWRMAKADTELGGVVIPQGSMVFACYGAANRDEAKFENADQLDPHRKNSGNHLVFGAGIHFCAGASLARMELEISANALLKRMANIRVTPGTEDRIVHNENSTSRSLTGLHLTFDRSQSA